jgi:5-formyltetrahydrofolate cyclo-ligase
MKFARFYNQAYNNSQDVAKEVVMDDPRRMTFASKEELREAVWAYLESHEQIDIPRPCSGLVPNFSNAQAAARLLARLPEWKRARVVFTTPDLSLHHVHCEALRDGKTLLVSAPCLTGFCLLSGVPPDKVLEATSAEGFALFGRTVSVDPFLPRIDLVVAGAVAMDKRGNRIGKEHGGFGDSDDEQLTKAGLMGPETPRVALVHDLQLFDDFSHLMGGNDRRVSIIVTPQDVWRVD